MDSACAQQTLSFGTSAFNLANAGILLRTPQPSPPPRSSTPASSSLSPSIAPSTHPSAGPGTWGCRPRGSRRPPGTPPARRWFRGRGTADCTAPAGRYSGGSSNIRGSTGWCHAAHRPGAGPVGGAAPAGRQAGGTASGSGSSAVDGEAVHSARFDGWPCRTPSSAEQAQGCMMACLIVDDAHARLRHLPHALHIKVGGAHVLHLAPLLQAPIRGGGPHNVGKRAHLAD